MQSALDAEDCLHRAARSRPRSAKPVRSRALALACARSDRRRHSSSWTRCEDTTRRLSPRSSLPASTLSVRSEVAHPTSLIECSSSSEVAFATALSICLVTTYRACPELLSRAPRDRRTDRAFRELVERVGDSDLASAVGHIRSRPDDQRVLASSPREREVYELLAQWPNEPSDRKAPLHRRVDRQGSRAPHLRQARSPFAKCANGPSDALSASDQATSATESTSSRERISSLLCANSREVRPLRQSIVLISARQDCLERRYCAPCRTGCQPPAPAGDVRLDSASHRGMADRTSSRCRRRRPR